LASSEEYLASLGLDFSDADRAVNSTISILGHLGAAFPEVAKQASKAEVALVGVGNATKKVTTATDQNTASQNRSSNATKKATESIISQRYALYDVASTYGILSTALLAADAYAIKVGADFESSFTNVQRTSGASATALAAVKQELLDLSTEIPRTFDEITKIATLGNQLGIDSSGLVEFTKNVSQFSAVTGIAVETVAQDFGTLGGLLQIGSDQYANLGSSIALAGLRAKATEAQITAVAGQIASYTQLAGFSAAETIGLATALASLKVPPEQARSAIQALFTTLNEATAEGGPKLQSFANVLGVTAQQAKDLIKNDPSKFVEVFAKSLGELDSEQLTLTLDALGLSEKRVATVLTKLSSNTDELTTGLANANQGFSEGTELARQYAIIADDLNTRFQELVNSVNALIAAASGGTVSGLAGLVSMLTDLANSARAFASNPLAQSLATTAAVVTAAVGLYFGLAAATALATASTYALTTAQTGLAAAGGSTGIVGMLRVLTPALFTLTGANSAATAATTGLTFATTANSAALGIVTGRAVLAATAMRAVAAIGIAGLVGFGAALIALPFIDVYLKAEQTAKGLRDVQDAAAGATFDVPQLSNSLKNALAEIEKFGDEFNGRSGATAQINAQVNSFFNQLGINATPDFNAAKAELAAIDAALANLVASGHAQEAAAVLARVGISGSSGQLPQYEAAVKAATDAMQAGTDSADDLSDAYSNVGSSAGGAAEQVRTLVDYANDLSGVFDRAFELRFGSGQALDTITSQWSSIKQAIADTNQQIAEYQAKMQSLSADKAVREYWLRVAENYGDALRAGVLRGEIAGIDTDLAKTSASLTKAQQKNSKTLVGNSDAAIENRGEILDLVKSYQDYLTTLASSGLSQDELAAKTAQLKAQFLAQAQGLGYSASQLGVYAAAFDDVSTAISLVPRDITVAANVNPALQAIAELQAKLKSLGGQSYPGPTITNPTNAKEIRRMALEATIAAQAAYINQLRAAGNISGAVNYSDYLDANRLKLQTGNYRSGGWTGNGNPWDVAGVVHGQEFVLNQTGAQMFPRQVLEAANQGRAPRFAGSGSSSGSSGGSGVVDLGSQTMRQLAEFFGSIYFGLTDADVGRANDRYHERVRSSGG